MFEALYLTVATLLGIVGMALLALSMEVHWAQVKQITSVHSQPPRTLLKALGYLALFVSLVVCLNADRPSIAVLVWMMLMIGSAVVVALSLAMLGEAMTCRNKKARCERTAGFLEE